MESVFENTYLKFLPDEILIAILKLLPFQDLIRFCESFENSEYLLKIKALINKIDPQQYIDLDLKQLVGKIDPLCVTNLNLNGYHWMSALELRSFVAKLRNLEKLSVLGTEFGLSDQDLKAYSMTKLAKLAVTIENTSKLKGKGVVIPTLNTLCLDIKKSFIERQSSRDEVNFETHDFLRVFPSLKNLCFDLPRTYNQFRANPWWSSGLRKLSLHGYLSTRLPDTVSKFYDGEKRKQNRVICYEHFDEPLSPKLKMPNDVWRHCLETVRCEIPWGPKDGRRLYTGEKDLETIIFEELNCSHFGEKCDDFRLAYKEILKLPNTHFVKKLSLSNCLLATPHYESRIDYHEEQFWTASHKDMIKNLNAFENEIVEDGCVLSNFKQVTHLELFACKTNWGIPNSHVIAQFTNLTSLFVQIPLKNNGTFMIEVAKNCKRLEKLWISCKGEYYAYDEDPVFNDEVNGNIAKALTHCTNLKEFTYYHYDLDLDELLTALKKIKLRKLVLKCESPSLTKKCLENYLEENPQLLYCFFKLNCLNGDGGSKRRIAEKMIQKYRKHEHNVFIVQGDYIADCSEPESSPNEDDINMYYTSDIEESLSVSKFHM